MKNIFSFLFVFLFILAFTGCTEKERTETNVPKTPTIVTTREYVSDSSSNSNIASTVYVSEPVEAEKTKDETVSFTDNRINSTESSDDLEVIATDEDVIIDVGGVITIDG